MATDGNKPLQVFFSYSHRDTKCRDRISTSLSAHYRSGLIKHWHDGEILPGTDWKSEIERHLLSADIVILLLSHDFIASGFCYLKEMKKALDRHRRKEAVVVPVIVHPCQWKSTPLKEIQALPCSGKAISEWSNRNAALNDVASGIATLAKALRNATQPLEKPFSGAEDGNHDVETQRGHLRGSIVHAGVDPSMLPDFARFKDVDAPWCPQMVIIPAGSFLMGAPETEEGRFPQEGPQHQITISRRFAIGRFPVTFAEYDAHCTARCWPPLPDHGSRRGMHPLINLSWEHAYNYCDWLTQKTEWPYRLPSEAEWEYACRAGTTTRYSFGDSITERDANFGKTAGGATEVDAYSANPWGLHDMHGNVGEWCSDSLRTYTRAAVTDPVGPSRLDWGKVVRGGCWSDEARQVRSASRALHDPSAGGAPIGFRVARTID